VTKCAFSMLRHRAFDYRRARRKRIEARPLKRRSRITAPLSSASWKMSFGDQRTPSTSPETAPRLPLQAAAVKSLLSAQSADCDPTSRGCWAYLNRHPSNGTDLFPASINLGASTGGPVKWPAREGSKSNAASSQRFRVAESMGFKGEFRQWEDC
jgi:hypothetical protein